MNSDDRTHALHGIEMMRKILKNEVGFCYLESKVSRNYKSQKYIKYLNAEAKIWFNLKQKLLCSTLFKFLKIGRCYCVNNVCIWNLGDVVLQANLEDFCTNRITIIEVLVMPSTLGLILRKRRSQMKGYMIFWLWKIKYFLIIFYRI